jgi:hypothetical protein
MAKAQIRLHKIRMMNFTEAEVYYKINKMEAILWVEKSWESVRTNQGIKITFNKWMNCFRAELPIR